MESSTNMNSGGGPRIALDLPTQGGNIFKSQAAHDILTFLSRHHTDEFSISDLQDVVDYSQPTVSKAVTVLAQNDLTMIRWEGNSRLVRINTERLSRPEDPVLMVPQAEFHAPVRAAVEELTDQLDGIVGIVVYGSVATGEADRRSDIDLWVLVEESRMENQRAANTVRKRLEGREFPDGRYPFEIDVESLQALPQYEYELREILSGGIVLHDTEEFRKVRNFIFHEEAQ